MIIKKFQRNDSYKSKISNGSEQNCDGIGSKSNWILKPVTKDKG